MLTERNLPPSTEGRGYYCYILRAGSGKRTYVGASVDPARRLRQHNGELSGGAKATRTGRPWRCVAVVRHLPSWSDALKLEWRLKRGLPGRRRRRSADRCETLNAVLTMPQWTRSATPTAELRSLLEVRWCALDAEALQASERLREVLPGVRQCVLDLPESAC